MSDDPRRCPACASYQPIDGRGERPGCTDIDAREAGAHLFPTPDFGCVFWSARDPAAHKARVIETALQVLYAGLYNQAGKTRLPKDVDKLDWATLARLEATALRLVQALGLLPP